MLVSKVRADWCQLDTGGDRLLGCVLGGCYLSYVRRKGAGDDVEIT